jgi:molybdopterin synthase catalytic subunit
MSHLQTESLDLAALLEITAQPDSGALVVFGGTVRNENDGRSVSGIEYTAYAPLAEKLMAEIEQDVMRKFQIQQCRIVHRVGELAVGDLSVLVVVRAAHRAEAFAAARHAIDTLKQRVPIWKNEHYRDGDSRYLEGTSLNLSSE